MKWPVRSKYQGVLGVDLQPQGVAVAHVRVAAEGRPRLLFCEYLPTGPARDQHTVLEEIVKRRGLKGVPCVGVLNRGEYQELQLEPPKVPANELRVALKWKLRDLIDFPLEQAVVDVYEPPSGSPRRPGHLNVVVTRSSLVAERVAVMQAAGLKVQAVDIVELALRNVVAAMPQQATGAALLGFADTYGLLLLVKQNELYLSRELETGLNGFPGGAGDEFNVPQLAYDPVLLEIQRSLDYFESNYALAAINQLYVLPADARVQAFLDYLSTNLPGLQAGFLDLSAALDLAAPLAEPQLSHCLHAIGAALRQEPRS